MRDGLAAVVTAFVVGACNFGSPGGNNVPEPGVLDDGSGTSVGSGVDDGADDGDDDGGGTLEGSGDGTPATTTGGVDPSDDGMDATDSGVASGDTAESSTGAPGSGAMIQLSDTPSYDFGPVPLFAPVEHAVTLTNVGDATATTITASVLAMPFSYAGTGTCVGVLDPGDACTIVVVFTPAVIGLVSDALTVEWMGGDETIAGLGLTGGGAGTSGNLLANPGGESPGNPPPSWSELNGSDWHTYDGSLSNPPASGFAPYMGAQSIFAGTGGQTVFVLAQGVDLSPWSTTIDASALQASASAWIRTLGVDNNPGRVRISFIDAGGSALGQIQTSTYSGQIWQQRSIAGAVPVGTRSILYELRCTKPAGESQCDAYFDDASLTVSHP